MKYKIKFQGPNGMYSSRYLLPFVRMGWCKSDFDGHRFGWFFVGWWRQEIGVTWCEKSRDAEL